MDDLGVAGMDCFAHLLQIVNQGWLLLQWSVSDTVTSVKKLWGFLSICQSHRIT